MSRMFNSIQIMPSGLTIRDAPSPAAIPRAGLVVSTILSMLTMSVLAVCLSKLDQIYDETIQTHNWQCVEYRLQKIGQRYH